MKGRRRRDLGVVVYIGISVPLSWVLGACYWLFEAIKIWGCFVLMTGKYNLHSSSGRVIDLGTIKPRIFFLESWIQARRLPDHQTECKMLVLIR